jgi:hypothetical protein
MAAGTPDPARWAVTGLVVAVCLWFWNAALLAPLRLLVVIFHESGHALMTWATGGRVEEVAIDLGGAGHTLSRGGWPLLILNAGYLGSLAWGLALMAAARGPARATCALVGVLLVALLGWMPFSLGLAFVAVAGLAFVAAAWRLPAPWCASLLRTIGVFSTFYALIDAGQDVGLGDAVTLAERTHVPALVWTAGWLVTGVATVWATRRVTVG